MNFVDTLVILVLLTVLYLSAVKSAHIPKEEGSAHERGYNVFSASEQKVPSFLGLRERGKDEGSTEAYQSYNESGWQGVPLMVIPFMDVYNKSMCQPRELLVEINQEYPAEVEYNYIPSCVPLMRCSGCCNDEILQCTPTSTHNITMQIKQVNSEAKDVIVLKSFTEHSACACSRKKEVEEQPPTECLPCHKRKKRLYIQDPLTCQCSCRHSEADCKARNMELNEGTCKCDQPRR
ncbi:hypothetical protein UPYG_G00253450 [Umbra pygmaea]|uniref:Platelet-derived growth factor (PDGF) family profile domain-containing protein n=1 Tax=Umbra pygmaea TaxID=75934 RepID=A0ABD0W9H6_UMBPY